jgi:hypothetical protein
MALNIPNPSRSYDATRRAVRFWGHDGPMEAAFFVNQDALRRIEPGVGGDEAGLLGAFDSHPRINPRNRREDLRTRSQRRLRADPGRLLMFTRPGFSVTTARSR